jgi:C4-dicarboxylate transporter DctM subunit
MEAIVMFALFFVLIAIGVPIGFSIGLSALAAVLMTDISLIVFAQRVVNAADSFALLAIPLFILSGELMNRGGLTIRLVNFAHSIIGHIRGGLGQTCVLASMIFAGVSGSAVADTTAIGSVMVPSMIAKGYGRPFVAALQAAAGSLGPIIPPSILMILYGSMTNVSIGGLFLAGFLPGVLIGLAFMVVVYVYASPRFQPGIAREKRVGFGAVVREAKIAIPALGMPIIIVGGIAGGVFTPTEAGTVATAYAFLVGKFYYKAFTFKDMPEIFISAASVTAMVMSIILFASVFGWLLAWQSVPEVVVGIMTSFTTNAYLFLGIVIVFLLILGTVMEVLAMATIFGPLLNIMGTKYGFDPVYFGVIILIVMQIGGITPPVGILLNITCGLARVKTGPCVPYVCVFVFVMMLVIALMIAYPPVAMMLPDMFLKK